MEPISAVGIGITKIMDYGLAMTVIVITGFCMFYLVKYLLNRCDDRFEKTLAMYQATAKEVKDVVHLNTIAWTEFKAELRNIGRQ